VLWLTPEQDGLFRGAPGDRRRFLDRMVLAVDPAHGARVTGFERLLRERNRLLEGYDPDARWLQAIEQEAAELGVAIAAARVDAVRRLAPLLEAEAMAPFPAADVAIEGTLERRIGAEPAAGTESWYREALRAGRGADRAARRALVGPQDADLIVRHRAKAMPAALSSTGEQKALLIGLVLAQARLVADRSGDPPILLLDEVAAHLDPGRRRALFALLETLGGQCLMTGVEEALFAGAPPGLLAMRVAGGAVGQAAPASPTGQATPVPPSPQ
jgi:DNA replication and repair protein RecF